MEMINVQNFQLWMKKVIIYATVCSWTGANKTRNTAYPSYMSTKFHHFEAEHYERLLCCTACLLHDQTD